MSFFNSNYSGKGITNSQVVTEEGRYALDAAQNNPDIEGSLRNEINSASERLNSIEMIKNFYTVRAFNTNHGQNGYLQIASIEILHANSNVPIMFEVSGRGWLMPAQLYILFINSGSPDPALSSFKYTGQLGAEVALSKLNTSAWGLYIQKSEEYDSICLHRYNYNYHHNKFNINFPSKFTESLPDDAVHPTLYK